MNLPNTLTLIRIFLVPLLAAALVQQDLRFRIAGFVFTNELLALTIFLAAGLTDLLDGYLARRWQQITTIGTLLDPIADKLLISSALIALVQVHIVPAWMTILVIGREFAISGLRSIAAAEGYVIKASDLGKTKLVTQVVAISLAMLSMRWPSLHFSAMIWLWGVIIFSMLSAFLYFYEFWNKIDVKVKARRRRELLILQRKRQKQDETATQPQQF